LNNVSSYEVLEKELSVETCISP